MAIMITWRDSNRKGSALYKNPYEGFTRADYAMEYESIPEASKIELLTRAYGHLLNNEVSSKVKGEIEKAEKEKRVFDAFKFVHDRRMFHKNAVLEGKLGVREARVVQEIDDVTREMYNMVHARLVSFVTKQGRTVGKGPSDFPDEYNNTTAKIVIQKGKTLAEMVAAIIESDPTWRVKAQKKVDEERAERLKNAGSGGDDEDLEAMFAEDEDESEDETESEEDAA